MGGENYLFMYDNKNRLIAINPDLISMFKAIDNKTTLVFFDGFPPKLLAHSIAEVAEGVDNFYKCN